MQELYVFFICNAFRRCVSHWHNFLVGYTFSLSYARIRYTAHSNVFAHLHRNRLFPKHEYFCFYYFIECWPATTLNISTWFSNGPVLDAMNMEQFIQNNDANYCPHSCKAVSKYPLVSSPNGNKKWKVDHWNCRLTQQWKNGILYAVLHVWLTDGYVMAHRNWCSRNRAIVQNGIQMRP